MIMNKFWRKDTNKNKHETSEKNQQRLLKGHSFSVSNILMGNFKNDWEIGEDLKNYIEVLPEGGHTLRVDDMFLENFSKDMGKEILEHSHSIQEITFSGDSLQKLGYKWESQDFRVYLSYNASKNAFKNLKTLTLKDTKGNISSSDVCTMWDVFHGNKINTIYDDNIRSEGELWKECTSLFNAFSKLRTIYTNLCQEGQTDPIRVFLENDDIKYDYSY